MTLHAMLRDNRTRFPERPWLRFGPQTWTYAEGDALTDRLAAGLWSIGIRKGDRVGLLLANCPEIVFCYFACFKIGAIAVPLNTRFQASELAYALGHAEARILIGHADLCSAVLPLREQLPSLSEIYVVGRPSAETKPFSQLHETQGATAISAGASEQVVALLYTSGTTAKPKGVIHSHATLLQQNTNMIETYGHDAFAVTAIAMPLCHIAGFSVQMLVATQAAGTIVILPGFDAENVLRTIEQSRATYLFTLPTHVNMMVNHPRADEFDLGSLRLCIAGGDCLPMELHDRFQAMFGVTIDEGCGMTEVVYTLQPRLAGERRVGSIGKPLGDVTIRLEDEHGKEVPPGHAGEIVVSSKAVTYGYWNDPHSTGATIRGGALYSGDLARRDDDGFYWFVGRCKDIIIRGGSNISPAEIEDVLYRHPAVYEAGVVGLPDPELGQKVRAYVALKPGIEATEADLIAWAGKSLAAYKVPESIMFAAQLPKGPTGKVLRRALRDEAGTPDRSPA